MSRLDPLAFPRCLRRCGQSPVAGMSRRHNGVPAIRVSEVISIMQRSLALRIGTCVAVALIVTAGAFFQFSRASSAHAAGITTGRTVIKGSVVPILKGVHPVGLTQSDRVLKLSIALAPRNSAKLAVLIANQRDPKSPLYHQYITPAEYNTLFAPSQATVDAVVGFLRGQGLIVGTIAPNHLLIDASGSAAAVQRAFRVTINDYSLHGRQVYAPANDPSVPSSLAGAIIAIGGLDDVGVYHPLDQAAATAHVGSGPAGGYTPSELRTAYDMGSLISGDNGSGQTVAIFELDGYIPADVNTYLSYYSLGSAKYSNVLVDGATNTAGAGAIEVELDMEDVSAIASGANQKIYIGPNTTQGVNDTYNKIVTDNIAKTASTSWGLCEPSSGTSELAALDTIFQQAAAQGQAIFAAAGDSGAYDCGDTNLAVDSPADDPNVVGVGGTSLNTGSGGTYSSETVWSCSSCTGNGSAKGEGGGGGLSTYFSQPSYQTGPGVSNSYSNGMREVPDVSADADPNTGYSMYCTVSAAGCPSSGWLEIGGTSAAAPLWAAVATDTNQYLAGQSKPTLGSGSAEIYHLFNTSQTYTAYHDITSGNNLYYPATSGYDMASGIGTPDVWNFARDAAGAVVSNDFSISASPTSLSIQQGNNGTSTISTAVTSGSAGTVSLTASVSPSGPTASLNPTSVTAGNSSTLTVSVGSSVATGTYTVTVTGTEGSAQHSTSVTVTVTAPATNDFSISASPTSLSIQQGNNGTSTISTAVTSGSAGTVSLTASVSPSGPTASLNPTSVTAGNSSTLTVSVGSSVATGTYTVTVTGTEGSAQHSATVTVTVTSASSGGITNGGFETGDFTGWTFSGQAHSISTTAHSGKYSAMLGSTSPTNGDSSISQTFTVPSGDGTLSFWYKVVCPDTVTYDWATATVKDNTTNTTTTMLGKTCNNNNTWVQVSTGVTAGHSLTLTLTSHDDNYPGDPTYTLYDDVALSAPVSNPVVNGGFEDGNFTGWTFTGQAHSISTTAHSGSYSAMLGSTSPTNGDSSISQTFTIPSGGSTVSFWYDVVCPDTVTYDWATATLKDNTTNTTKTILAKTCVNGSGWILVNASATAGHSVTLTLTSHDDNYPGDPTYTLFDDVSAH